MDRLGGSSVAPMVAPMTIFGYFDGLGVGLLIGGLGLLIGGLGGGR